jgi:hypothetical protein
LTYQFGYTLARDIGDVERGETIENAYDRAHAIERCGSTTPRIG